MALSALELLNDEGVMDDVLFWTSYFTYMDEEEIKTLHRTSFYHYNLLYYCLELSFKAILGRITDGKHFQAGNMYIMLEIVNMLFIILEKPDLIAPMQEYVRQNAIVL
jgi:hypothetical protein